MTGPRPPKLVVVVEICTGPVPPEPMVVIDTFLYFFTGTRLSELVAVVVDIFTGPGPPEQKMVDVFTGLEPRGW